MPAFALAESPVIFCIHSVIHSILQQQSKNALLFSFIPNISIIINSLWAIVGYSPCVVAFDGKFADKH